MKILPPAKVTERVLLLGHPEACVYLVRDGDESVLLGGGMDYIAPALMDQLQAMAVDERSIKRICILHSHFDHCGVVPFLKQRWPWAVVTASPRAQNLLAKPEVTAAIAQMNRAAAQRMGLDAAVRSLGCDFTQIRVEETVAEGDLLTCGALNLQTIEVPGHSSCSIACYCSSEKALFASDAVGLEHEGVYQPTPNSNFDEYQQSLAKLAGYDVDCLLLEHYGAYTGDDARQFIPRAIEAARELRALLEETYLKTRDVEKCTQEMTDLMLQRAGDSFLPREVRALVAGQMVRYIAKTL
ncbi:MBL fold metallo-hydrolase [Desulfatitalea alkaliphila]|uniref:MBL fold metallo-hydrolase n=1 Tax=Desulfatitalea alkaliphila TaxID=2929485 RepID=A0AA41UKA3_9BACT|nr:MBL fold metallo-hydrolase [Desulfatitalea alkaliphila]MCJ8501237.1 MBL fold metallo-hydrolase [Desulfatitalea alkaliphila]